MSPIYIKYGGPFPTNPKRRKIDKLVDEFIEQTCKCGNKIEQGDQFCSQCGLARKENLTADERKILAHIKELGEFNLATTFTLQRIIARDPALSRLAITIHSLEKKGYITLENAIAKIKKTIHNPDT